jgi:hypothetical protein
MMEALSSSETSVHTRETRRKIPEEASLHSNRRKNIKSYIMTSGWVKRDASLQGVVTPKLFYAEAENNETHFSVEG